MVSVHCIYVCVRMCVVSVNVYLCLGRNGEFFICAFAGDVVRVCCK